MGKCKWCHYGTMSVGDGSSISYRCTDCGGTGWIPECDICGKEYHDDYCEECYSECLGCGDVCLKSDMQHGMCADCYDLMCKHCHGTGYLKSYCDLPDPICHFCNGTGRKD